jgi:CBS domain-containing protein
LIGVQVLDAPLSVLYPDLYSMSRPITTPDVPVVVAASMLTAYDAPMLPLTKLKTARVVERDGVRLYQAVGSLPMITLLLETKPSEYYKALWNSCSTTSVWIGSMRYEESLDRLVRVFAMTGFGDARVDFDDSPPALITLIEVASLYKERKLSCPMPAREVASKAIFIEPEATIIDAMRTMCERRVRRLFLKGTKGEYVSDRSILSLLFSPRGLKAVRDSPESWTDFRVSDLRPSKAHLVSPDAMVEDVGSLVEPGRDVFVLWDWSSMVSRWDLVIKPWKAGKLRLTL